MIYAVAWKRFQTDLRRRGEAGPGQMTTIADVAARAGVGVGTVSRVLNNNPHISPQTRARVLAAIAELGYQPNQMARALSRGRTQTVGVIVPFFTSPSVVERLRGMVETLRQTGYDLILYNVESVSQRHEHFRSLAQPGRVDGVLVVSLRPEKAEIKRFREARIPLVLVDSAHPDVPHVIIDDFQGGYMAARHLLDLGHRRVAFVGDPEQNPFGFTSSVRRLAGFRQALLEAGVPLPDSRVREGPHGRHVAHRLTSELLALPDRPTAIFAASDTQALGVLEAAQEHGLAVPQDLSIIGFDDIEVSPYVGLTTVRQPLAQSGARGASLLLAELAGQGAGGVEEVLPLELVLRKTTAPPKRRDP